MTSPANTTNQGDTMAIDVSQTLRTALKQLESDKKQIERQLAAIRQLLTANHPSTRRPRRRRLSAAARHAVSQRMKAYWAKRRASAAKGKAAGARKAK
jgi:hypothetical protein